VSSRDSSGHSAWYRAILLLTGDQIPRSCSHDHT
jgi:hypothetical protein